MQCRSGCGACCIAPSISTPIPGMPQGKAAGVRCIQLDTDNRCKIFGNPLRPPVCEQFQAERAICGDDNQAAMTNLIDLEQITR